MQDMQDKQVRSLGWENPLEKEMATHSSILAWRTHGQRSLVGYSPCNELDATEHIHRGDSYQLSNTTMYHYKQR